MSESDVERVEAVLARVAPFRDTAGFMGWGDVPKARGLAQYVLSLGPAPHGAYRGYRVWGDGSVTRNRCFKRRHGGIAGPCKAVGELVGGASALTFVAMTRAY